MVGRMPRVGSGALDVRLVTYKGTSIQRLETVEGRRASVLICLFVLHIYHPLKANYIRKYVENIGSPRATGCSSSSEPAWRWQSFPRMWPGLIWYRKMSTIYMIYVVIKNIFPVLLEAPLNLLDLSKPSDCYLLGKLIPNVSTRAAIASLLAIYHLGWRYYQIYDPQRNYMISTIYFLMLDDRDLTKYYELLNTNGFSVVDERIDKRTTMFHDIMTLRFNQGSTAQTTNNNYSITYRLRPNRTPEAGKMLRQHLILTIVPVLVVSIPMTLVLFAIDFMFSFNTQTYLENYSGCNHELQRLYETTNQPKHISWIGHLNWHQLLATVFDIMENVILWFDSALVTMFAFPLFECINYDLELYWKYLDHKTAKLLRRAKYIRQQQHWPNKQGRNYDLVEIAENSPIEESCSYELLMEWQDFIRQIKHSDAFIGDCTTTFVVVWFTLFGVVVLESMSGTQKGNTLSVILVIALSIIITVMTTLILRLLSLHRHCLTSYTKFCSLMAHTDLKHRLKFHEVIDYFTRGRSCFTLFRKRKMNATTYLTIAGWSVSCFFIIGSVNRNR